MLNNNFASQSTAARNSAVVNFSNNSYYSDKIQIPILGFSRDSIITWVGEAVEDKRRDVRFCGYIEGGKSIEVHLDKDYFSKNYNVMYTIFDDGKVNMEKSGSIDLGFKVLSGTNINKAVWAITRALEELPYYFVTSIDSNEIEAIEDAEISEAPVLDEAPCLEEDDITENGCSVAGLAYVKENTIGVDMADILKEVAEFHWDVESVVKENRWTRFTNDSFKELIWSTCWSEYLVDYTDEALEFETRYVMDFDSVYDDLFGDLWPYMSTYDESCGGCELWVDSWYVVERAAEIIEESVADSDTRCIYWDEFPDYMMAAFLGDLYGFETFTERVMSELEGGDIVDILPYDDGLYLSFVDDEAEVAADSDDDAERIAAVIKEYYNNYIPSYLDQFGECVITVYWNRFSEADMMMLIENEKVALAVRDILLSDNIILDKNGFLVYDDGVYLTVDYNKIAKKVAA